MFGNSVTVLTDLKDYSNVPPRSPMLYYSPHCGHCVRFAPEYSAWASQMRRSSPRLKVYALDLSAVEPEEAMAYNRAHSKDTLPEYVPVMAMTGGVRGNRGVERVLWSERDGPKTAENLTRFLMLHKDIDEANLRNSSEENYDLGGGATHHKNKTRASPRMSPKRRSPAKKHHSKSTPKRGLSSPLKRWNALVLKETGSRQVLRKDHPMYARVKKLYAQMRK